MIIAPITNYAMQLHIFRYEICLTKYMRVPEVVFINASVGYISLQLESIQARMYVNIMNFDAWASPTTRVLIK